MDANVKRDFTSDDLDLDPVDQFAIDSGDDDDNDDVSYIDTDRMSSLFNISEPPGIGRLPTVIRDFNRVSESDNEEEYLAVRKLALYGSDDDDVIITSDEERDIMKEIKEEIKKNVATEMHKELEVYREARERLHLENNEAPKDNLADVDPKMKEAILKMRKLDRILLRKMDKEKKVKRDRIMLQKRCREELESLHRDGRESSLDEKKNTEKFLALALPASHNVGVKLDSDDDKTAAASSEISFTPLFATEPPETASVANGRNSFTSAASPDTDRGSVVSSASSSRTGTSRTTVNSRRTSTGLPSVSTSKVGSTSRSTASRSSVASGGKIGGRPNRRQKRHADQKDKDFVKRNIQLASEAQNIIAMTDDEKKRVEDLLADVNGLSDIQEEETSRTNDSVPVPQLSLMTRVDDGFWPRADERSRMEDIDSRLKMLLPAEEFELLTSASPVSFTTRSDRTLSSDIQTDDDRLLGEKFLTEFRQDRSLKARLKEIDDALLQLSSRNRLEDSPKLSEETLNNLLEECSRSLTRTGNDSSRPNSGYRAIMYENAPRLEDSVLRQLLAEARCASSALGELADGVNQPVDDTSSSPNGFLALEYKDAATERRNGSDYSSRSSLSGAPTYDLASNVSRPRSTTAAVGHHSVDQANGPTSTSVRREPFLPSIDPAGCLSTHRPSTSDARLTGGDRRSYADVDRSAAVMNVWNGQGQTMSTASRDSRLLPSPDFKNSSFRKDCS